MSFSELDDLLCDLERECNSKKTGLSPSAAFMKQQQQQQQTITTTTTTTAGQKPVTTTTTSTDESFYQHIPVASSTPFSKGPQSRVIVSQNLNELDNLLEDLSNVKLSIQPNGKLSSPSGTIIRETETRSQITKHIEVEEKTEIIVESRTLEEERRWRLNHPEIDGVIKRTSATPSPPPPPARQISSVVITKTMADAGGNGSFNVAAASTATQELDELMSSLNSFRMKDVGHQASETPVNTTLDDMLGNLQEEMDKQGIKTSPKGICFECKKPVVGQVITALGRTFHPEHFVCDHCNQELGTQSFFERNGKPYCEKDYHMIFSPKCAGCQGPILDKCISALDQTWHPEHFVCGACAEPFGDEGFHDKDGKAFCNRCFFSMFAPKCGGCGLPIIENYISCLDSQWHRGCFVCTTCKQPFTEGNFFEHEGSPYCETHFHALRGSLCAGCNKPISGRCITAMFRKFHPEHFVCSFCLKQLNKGTFKEQGEKPYCHECFDRLFG